MANGIIESTQDTTHSVQIIFSSLLSYNPSCTGAGIPSGYGYGLVGLCPSTNYTGMTYSASSGHGYGVFSH